jgi:quercetin dioxygenase-like cupin family protein
LNKILVVLVLICGTLAHAQKTTVTPLLSKDLVGMPDQEVTMMTVTLAAGAADSIHRHNAQVFVYVLEGTVLMQVRGQQQVTLHPGETFYEGPEDVHVVGRSASTIEPAKFLAFFVKNKSAPISVPAH